MKTNVIVGVEEEVLIRTVALLADIHERLLAGKSIKVGDQDVLLKDGAKHGAPTIAEYIGGVLEEIKAKEILK